MMKVGTLALQKTRVSNLSLISLYYFYKLEIYSLIIWVEYKLLRSEFEQLIHFITGAWSIKDPYRWSTWQVVLTLLD
jgi:hypothetical protein